MKFFGYISRNARRNPVRSLLTVASITVCLFLTMILLSYLSINDEVSSSLKAHNRVASMSSQGFAQAVPIALLNDVRQIRGVAAASPFSWYGGKYNEETMPFAQFAIDPDEVFKIYDELKISPNQLKSFREDKAGCVIGKKLAADRGLKVGDPLPLKGTIYPFDLNLTVRGMYDGPSDRNLRMCFFHWDYLDEGLKRDFAGRQSGNAGMIFVKCESADLLPTVSKAIDDLTRNTDSPTRTQTEEAFVKMFAEMMGDMRLLIQYVGLSVVVSLVCVAGVAMAMAMRERTTEVAVLKAIGFGKGLVLWLVIAESVLIAGIGGLLGALGSKLFFDAVDISPYTAGMIPFFYIPWTTALYGLGFSLLIGLLSGVLPALRAANLSVVNGLRKVV